MLESSSGSGATILIVDDDALVRRALQTMLEHGGHVCRTAVDGAEGLERALADNPDLVVLDVMMPRMSGLDVCKQLKIQRPSMPIIMLTARGQNPDRWFSHCRRE